MKYIRIQDKFGDGFVVRSNTSNNSLAVLVPDSWKIVFLTKPQARRLAKALLRFADEGKVK